MLQCSGKIRVADGILYDRELRESMKKLQKGKDGEFVFVVVNKDRKKSLGTLKYLFMVLKVISDSLVDHPTTDQLYRYFSDKFAPIHRCTIGNEVYEYYDLKKEHQTELGIVVERIIQYAEKKWGIKILTLEDLKNPENSALYAISYANQWEEWSELISSKR